MLSSGAKLHASRGCASGEGGWALPDMHGIWPIRGYAAGQGIFFDVSVLNKVNNFPRVCPKQGI